MTAMHTIKMETGPWYIDPKVAQAQKNPFTEPTIHMYKEKCFQDN